MRLQIDLYFTYLQRKYAEELVNVKALRTLNSTRMIAARGKNTLRSFVLSSLYIKGSCVINFIILRFLVLWNNVSLSNSVTKDTRLPDDPKISHYSSKKTCTHINPLTHTNKNDLKTILTLTSILVTLISHVKCTVSKRICNLGEENGEKVVVELLR